MESLGPGSRSMAVRVAQRLMNVGLRQARGFTHLAEDGVYGRRTEDGVALLQELRSVRSEAGFIGPLTWRAMGLAREIDHSVRLIGQQYEDGCWSAAAAMVMGVEASIGPGMASLQHDAEGHVGGLSSTAANVTAFADVVGGRAVDAPEAAGGLIAPLSRGPLWFAGDARVGHRWAGHVVVISGLWTNGTPAGTLIRIHDPWPVGRGAIYLTDYPRARVAGYPFRPWAIIVR